MPTVPYAERLVAAFVGLADTLTDDFDAIEFLHMLTEHCVSLLDIAAAGVLLATPEGYLVDAAASDPETRRLELDSVDWGSSPCHDCFHAADATDAAQEHHLNNEAARTRWPDFSSRAQALGYESVVTAPLQLRRQTIGALNLFRHGGEPLSGGQLRLARALADIAAIGILQQRAATEQAVVTARLQETINQYTMIEQAKGVLAHHRQVSLDEAFALMRAHADAHRRLLSDLAREVAEGIVDRTLLAPQPSRFAADGQAPQSADDADRQS